MTNNTPEPMSDERLAELEESPLADAEDAAAEIRRLREERRQYLLGMESWQCGRIQQLEAEIERLTKQRNDSDQAAARMRRKLLSVKNIVFKVEVEAMTNKPTEPMSDERLAELEESPLADAEDAAAEIRRLREVMNQRELDTMQTLIDRASDCDKHLKRIDELEAEVEQLAKDNKALTRQIMRYKRVH